MQTVIHGSIDYCKMLENSLSRMKETASIPEIILYDTMETVDRTKKAVDNAKEKKTMKYKILGDVKRKNPKYPLKGGSDTLYHKMPENPFKCMKDSVSISESILYDTVETIDLTKKAVNNAKRKDKILDDAERKTSEYPFQGSDTLYHKMCENSFRRMKDSVSISEDILNDTVETVDRTKKAVNNAKEKGKMKYKILGDVKRKNPKYPLKRESDTLYPKMPENPFKHMKVCDSDETFDRAKKAVNDAKEKGKILSDARKTPEYPFHGSDNFYSKMHEDSLAVDHLMKKKRKNLVDAHRDMKDIALQGRLTLLGSHTFLSKQKKSVALAEKMLNESMMALDLKKKKLAATQNRITLRFKTLEDVRRDTPEDLLQHEIAKDIDSRMMEDAVLQSERFLYLQMKAVDSAKKRVEYSKNHLEHEKNMLAMEYKMLDDYKRSVCLNLRRDDAQK